MTNCGIVAARAYSRCHEIQKLMSTWAFDTMHLENAHWEDDYLLQMTAFWSQSLFGGLHARKTNANLPPHAVS